MIYGLSRCTRDASCDRCGRTSSLLTAPSFEVAANALRAACWYVTVSGRTYCPVCVTPAEDRPLDAKGVEGDQG